MTVSDFAYLEALSLLTVAWCMLAAFVGLLGWALNARDRRRLARARATREGAADQAARYGLPRSARWGGP